MAKDDFTNGVWRTVGGRRIFIRDGQSLSDAMKASGKFKGKNIEKEKQKAFSNEDEQFQRRMEEYYDRSQKQGGYNPDVKEKIREAYGKTEEEMNQKIKEIGDNRVKDESEKESSKEKSAKYMVGNKIADESELKKEYNFQKKEYGLKEDYESFKERRTATKENVEAFNKGLDPNSNEKVKKINEKSSEKKSLKDDSDSGLPEKRDVKGDYEWKDKEREAEYNRQLDQMREAQKLQREYEYQGMSSRDAYLKAQEEVKNKKQQGVQKLKDKLSGNKEEDEVATVRSQMSEIEQASGSKVKDAFQTDLFGNGKENRFILEDGTIVGHTLESFGEKTDDWYVGNRHFKSYDDVKSYLSGGSGKSGFDSSKDEHIKKSFDKLYGTDRMDKVSREEFLNDLKDRKRIAQSDYDSLQRTYGFESKSNNSNRTLIEKDTGSAFSTPGKKYELLEESKSAYGDKIYKVKDEKGDISWQKASKFEEKSASNSSTYKKAFEEYKKKHPNTKLTLQKFIDMSEGK